ncbi:VTS1 [Candida pseudojiufengensis]|uniref:VTS1 n=1 Tax=Candida pseudojiufengensis TaxID=497109 RepID=UPI002225AD3C|nr:VTS1 [Candida pseudojiufengensis]KAI5966474.1 VTS1 [Candida pseudojiufengensis]
MELNESQQSLTSSSSQKPIIFSPPTLSNNSTSKFTFNQQLPELPNDFNSNRQQSVGYNLQHEFETLTAELDLDLNNNQIKPSHSAPPEKDLQQQQQVPLKQQKSGNDQITSDPLVDFSRPTSNSTLIAPSASKLNPSNPSSNLLNSNTSTNFNRSNEINSLSPTPSVAASNPQINSLLDSKGLRGATGSFLHPPSASIPDRPQSANDFTNIFNRAGHAFTNFGASGLQNQQQQQQPQQQQQQQQSQSQQLNLAPQSNFYSDLLIFSNWIENLNPQDTISMIDYLCASLPIDVLLTFQAKLDNHLQTNKQQTTVPQYVMSSYDNLIGQDLNLDLENLNLNDQKIKYKQQQFDNQQQQNQQVQPQNYLNVDKQNLARPKSADPFLNNQKSGNQHTINQNRNQHQNHSLDRSKSPTSHLYEKTNFLQLAAANPSHPQYYYNQYNNNSGSIISGSNNNNLNNVNNQSNNSQFYSPQSLNSATSPGNGLHQDGNLDMSNTALKLGALATINSRVALDSNRKHPHAGTNTNWSNQQHHHNNHNHNHHHHNYNNNNHHHQQISPQNSNNFHNLNHLNAMNYEDSLNRISNSSSVPTTSSYYNNNNNNKNFNSTMGLKKRISSPISSHMQQQNISTSSLNSQLGNINVNSSSMPLEVSSLEYLNNIPSWLKLLRLHKYTDFLKDIYWKDLIELNNEELEEKGVAALGARRKLLKAFEMVKEVHGDDSNDK